MSNFKNFLGHRRGEDGEPEIDEEEAPTIRRIFARYLMGQSVGQICRDLTADGCKTARGSTQWSDHTVRHILQNEKYMGDAILQKTFTLDLFSRQQVKNEGQLPKYYVENAHPAIIDRATFQKVQEDGHKLDWLEDKPFTTLFVCGNHENFDLLSAYPEQDWHGGRVHVVRPHILHLMRGQVFEIGGLTWFTMGGAASHDIEDGILDPAAPDFERRYWMLRRMGTRFRVLDRSWWPEEMPSEAEYAGAETNLERAGWCVDCILTHCAPTSIARLMNRHYQPDELTDFLETIKERCQFSKWFSGHYHVNQVIDERFVIQWGQISKIEAESI